MNINALSAFATIRAVVPHMKKQRWGRIVNLSSGWGAFDEGLGGLGNDGKASLLVFCGNMNCHCSADAMTEQDLGFDAARFPVLLREHFYKETSYLALNPARGYGLLRLMGLDERPGSRDIVIYKNLPNELSRVGGVITTVPQTPLSSSLCSSSLLSPPLTDVL